MNRAVLSLAALVACEPFHRSLEYQRSIHVIARQTIPGEGTYEVFTDEYKHCHVDFEADPYLFSSPASPLLRVAPSFSPTADPFREQALLEKYCPDSVPFAPNRDAVEFELR